MGNHDNAAKQRWNARHYTQVKVSVAPEIATAFKEKCLQNGVSMASVLSRFMSAQTYPPLKPLYDTRQKRRKALRGILDQLHAIKDAEQVYLDNIPPNLQSSKLFEAAELTVATLEEAISLLEDAY